MTYSKKLYFCIRIALIAVGLLVNTNISASESFIKVDPKSIGLSLANASDDPTAPITGMPNKGIHITNPFGLPNTSSSSGELTSLAYTNILGLLRWPAGNKYNDWISITDGKGYFRDSFTAIRYLASASQDGDYWDTKLIISPTEKGKSEEQYYWARVNFYASIGGYSNCFYANGWAYAICGTTSIYLTSYIKSQCMTFGFWNMYVYENGAEKGFRQLAMYPEVPPSEMAYESQSSSSRYDGICYITGNPSKTLACDPYAAPPPNMSYFTIGQKGCALTSTAMVLKYLENISSYSPSPISKENLNDYLTSLSQVEPKNSNGYSKEGGVIWGGAASFSDDAHFIQINVEQDDKYVRDKVCSRGPQVMAVKPKTLSDGRIIPGHFVTVVGRDISDETWKIYDPNPKKGITTLSDYGNVYLGTRIFSGNSSNYTDPLNRLTFTIYSPADLLVTDPLGRITGFDPISKINYTQIPGSGYQGESLDDGESGQESESHWFVLDIYAPIEGKYTVQVTGTDTGTYDLEVRTTSLTGDASPVFAMNSIKTERGKIQRYELSYSATSTAMPALKPVAIPDPIPPSDTTPPSISVILSPNVIWPPNHRMVEITADIVVEDDVDTNPIVTLDSITCNECEASSSDIEGADTGTDDRLFYVLGERSGIGRESRLYTVTYSAKDSAGNISTTTAQVTIPHNLGN